MIRQGALVMSIYKVRLGGIDYKLVYKAYKFDQTCKVFGFSLSQDKFDNLIAILSK